MRRLMILGAAGLFAVSACGTDSGTTGRITIQLTDASCADIAAAQVWVSQVYLIGGADSTGPHQVVSSTQQHYDLLDLQGGVTATLGSATVPAGDYEQLRLVVDSARVTLGGGLTFAGGGASVLLTVPSGAQTGIKVNFSGPVHIASGETILVVDFDVCRSFRFTGPPLLPTGALFTPVLHASARDIAGSIAGTVTPIAARAQLFAILNGDTVQTTLADTLTGAYVLRFLPPGSYTVAAKATGYQVSTASTTVADAQNVTGVNFTLSP